jgi:hypothetical protein
VPVLSLSKRPAIVSFAGMARSYNTGYLSGHVEPHNGEISKLSRSFFNWSHSIEKQGTRTED